MYLTDALREGGVGAVEIFENGAAGAVTEMGFCGLGRR